MDQKDIDRFWSKVNKLNELDACWEWTAGSDDYGYGMFWLDGGIVRVHRVSYLITHGIIPPHMDVCHTCDNPSCVRPDHLFLGTRKDNLQDAVQKGRMSVGERNGRAKLTAAQVKEIRKRYPLEKPTYHSLAAEYGRSDYAIRAIIHRLTWKHI